ncbi:hypothetical protein ACP70R_031672 [Stipagrostis hirtigluma subsp. patula]
MAASRAPVSAAAADGGIEENAMAILDSSGIKDSRDLHDDRAAFLDAVRSACLAGDNPSAPSWAGKEKAHLAYPNRILRNSSSLELAVASFSLLLELGKQYPRTYLTNSGAHQVLVVVKESWLPFLLGNDTICTDIGGNARNSDHLFDPSRFSLLIENMVEPTDTTDANNEMKSIKNMMLFQYLVNTLEADFVLRHVAYKVTRLGDFQGISVKYASEGSRKLVFKSLVKNCIYLVLNHYHHEAEDAVEDSIPSEGHPAKSESDTNSSLNFSSFELGRTLESVQKLFVMVMNLDLIRKEADTLGLTSRADGFRNSIMEIFLDELTYNISYLSPFLLAFADWKWKLEIILQYFSKYCGKAAVRTRRSDNSQQDLTLESVLSFFLTTTSAKAMAKKMSSEVAQLLLAHAYQVCLSVQGDSRNTTATTEKIGASLQQISCSFISAFQNLQKINLNIQISPFEKEALFTAATLTRKLKNEER